MLVYTFKNTGIYFKKKDLQRFRGIYFSFNKYIPFFTAKKSDIYKIRRYIPCILVK